MEKKGPFYSFWRDYLILNNQDYVGKLGLDI